MSGGIEDEIVRGWVIRSPSSCAFGVAEGLRNLNVGYALIKVRELAEWDLQGCFEVGEKELQTRAIVLAEDDVGNGWLDDIWETPFQPKIIVLHKKGRWFDRFWSSGNNLSEETRDDCVLLVSCSAMLTNEDRKVIRPTDVK